MGAEALATIYLDDDDDEMVDGEANADAMQMVDGDDNAEAVGMVVLTSAPGCSTLLLEVDDYLCQATSA